MTQVRLDKYLADMQIGTRSQVKEYIRKGRILVDGIIIKQSDAKVPTDGTVEIAFDGKPVSYTNMEYYMLNKPFGVVSAASDDKYKTVVDIITTKKRKDLFPVGRLDKDTEGLLIITNDGQLSHKLLSPKNHFDKVYYAKVRGIIDERAINLFQNGIKLNDDFTTMPAGLNVISVYRHDNLNYISAGKIYNPEAIHENDSYIDELSYEYNGDYSEVLVTIQEGKFHQIKKMFEFVNSEVLYLKRISMGNLSLDKSLAPGEYRPLTKDEVNLLYK